MVTGLSVCAERHVISPKMAASRELFPSPVPPIIPSSCPAGTTSCSFSKSGGAVATSPAASFAPSQEKSDCGTITAISPRRAAGISEDSVISSASRKSWMRASATVAEVTYGWPGEHTGVSIALEDTWWVWLLVNL